MVAPFRVPDASAMLRGGDWNNGANDGVFAANPNNAPSNVNTNIGFRCAYWSVAAVRLGKVAPVACGKSRALRARGHAEPFGLLGSQGTASLRPVADPR